MPLPVPNLDDRTFDNIVDDALRLIPRTTPEWTDHNIGDPGRTLIELFAWMTELLLYRVNQVPDKMYRHFLNTLGMSLRPPQPAKAPVAFWLSAAQTQEVHVPAGVEVATTRSEGTPAVVFTTDAPLVIRPAVLLGGYLDHTDRPAHRAISLERFRSSEEILVFSSPPGSGDLFGLVLAGDLSAHHVSIAVTCDEAGGRGVDPEDPPWIWETWRGPEKGWEPIAVRRDGTGGFNKSGQIQLSLPEGGVQGRWSGLEGTGLRCRAFARPGQAFWQTSPKIRDLAVESSGATVRASHCVPVRDEILGLSDGTAGQRFRLQRSPVVNFRRERDELVVEPSGGVQETGDAVAWSRVEDFSQSGPEDRHYTLDPLEGVLQFGPSLLQPDGSMRGLGAIPPKGWRLRMCSYQIGGGLSGNVPAGALCVLRTATPYIARVENLQPASGGFDAQSLEDALARAPAFVRARSRAVLASDYEVLALDVTGVGRARCLAPGEIGQPAALSPGTVRVVVLPSCGAPGRALRPEQLRPEASLIEAVQRHLDALRPAGVRLLVEPASVVWVTLRAQIQIEPGLSRLRSDQLKERAELALRRHLDPWSGGADGRGWPFGRTLLAGELTSILQRLKDAQYVEGLVLLSAPRQGAPSADVGARLTLPPDAVIALDEVHVVVSET